MVIGGRGGEDGVEAGSPVTDERERPGTMRNQDMAYGV
jgi:hypothetical protein